MLPWLYQTEDISTLIFSDLQEDFFFFSVVALIEKAKILTNRTAINADNVWNFSFYMKEKGEQITLINSIPCGYMKHISTKVVLCTLCIEIDYIIRLHKRPGFFIYWITLHQLKFFRSSIAKNKIKNWYEHILS